jgi:hypothetical protein
LIDNDEKKKIDKIIQLNNNENLRLTIPSERWSATHLPAITEQVAKRKQQFQVKVRFILFLTKLFFSSFV